MTLSPSEKSLVTDYAYCAVKSPLGKTDVLGL